MVGRLPDASQSLPLLISLFAIDVSSRQRRSLRQAKKFGINLL